MGKLRYKSIIMNNDNNNNNNGNKRHHNHTTKGLEGEEQRAPANTTATKEVVVQVLEAGD